MPTTLLPPNASEIRINELDLTRAGIISVQKVLPDSNKSWQVRYDIQGVVYEVQGDAAYGRPYGNDADVLLAIQALFFKAGCPEHNSIEFTPGSLLKLMNAAQGGREYARIREALLRLSGVKWKLIRTVWNAQKNKFVGDTTVSGLLSRLRLMDDVAGSAKNFADRKLNEHALIELTFTPDFAASIRAGLFQILDGELLARLGQPTTRSLYRVLQAHRVQSDGTLSRELDIAAGHWLLACGMETERFANARRTLELAQERLLEEGYLKDATFTGRGKAGMFHYRFASAPVPQLVDLLMARGVTRPVAESLTADHPERIAPALQAINERLTSGWKPRSVPASTVDAVRNPDKWGYASAPVKARKRPARVAVDPEPPTPLPDPRAVILSALKLKLKRAPSPMAIEALEQLSADGLEQLRSSFMLPSAEYLVLAQQCLKVPL